MTLDRDKAPLSFLLICKAIKTEIDEIIFNVKSQYSANNNDQITLVQNFLSIEEVHSFEGIQERTKNHFKIYQRW